jgi:hypothetical protein
MLDALVASAARHSRRSIVSSSFYLGEIAELRRVSIGPDLVFGRLWRETACGEVINALLADRRFGFDVERAIYLTVLHRLMVSGSDCHASRWHQGFRIPGTEGLMLDHAYWAMAWLGEEIADGRTTTDVIEEDLYRRRQELFGEVSIAFFDTTSLYFEARAGRRWDSSATARTIGRILSRWCSAWCSTATTGRSPHSCGPAIPPM